MTTSDRLEQMPAPGKVLLAFLAGVALIFAGLVGGTLLLVVFKIAIGGIC